VVSIVTIAALYFAREIFIPIALAGLLAFILTALPPYAISHARLLYRSLRTPWPDLKIVVGLWNFSDDPTVALSRIGMKGEGSILTSLSQVLQTVGLAAELAHQKEHASV
jgi:hypothetical protein